ncbi:hypothetical protein FA13DRAFT_1778500 [Coprinellus micaceus]|uniref:Nephrocystin 3-like N-terminal domain-containing protein n=1 Tax=Coprinellus micaceus TaxID=71717 RepID=A0A4Y7SM41_COPMI|nr:hypothetical protein FA13DRAFT_1778500 [Coprinellus micaceus]
MPTTSRHIAVHELNATNIARDYRDYSHHHHRTKIAIGSGSSIELLDRLLRQVAHGAVHDSAERGLDVPKCHPETRTAVQRDIMGWIRHGQQEDSPKKTLWLSGPAGSGKTAIAGTIADECSKRGLLAASFFFSAFAGPMNRRSSKPLISTLVYSLLQHKSIIGLKREVLTVVKDDPMVFDRHLDQQLKMLILRPLRNVLGRSHRRHWPQVIIIDGLDECQGSSESEIDPEGNTQASGAKAQQEILAVLSRACADPTFPFRIIVASRPEPVMRYFFSNSPYLTHNIFLDDKYDPDSDIRLFLKAMFSDLRRRYNLPSTWASGDVIDILVQEASGQFIYASTIIRFLQNPRLGPPQQQLNRVLAWRRPNGSTPFAPLDFLYNSILRTSPDPLLTVRWMRGIETLRRTWKDIDHLKCILEAYPGATEHVLGTTTSLVGLEDEYGRLHFHFYHKTLLDFLKDPQRSSDLHVSEESLRQFVVDRYYQVLRTKGPQSGGDPATNISSSPWGFLEVFCKRLESCIDPQRTYASGDVEWWLSSLFDRFNREEAIPGMFATIHQQCKWYRCCPACVVWRKGILQYCREHGWRVPTRKETLGDRFKKLKFDDPDEFPLRDPKRSLNPFPTSRRSPRSPRDPPWPSGSHRLS